MTSFRKPRDEKEEKEMRRFMYEIEKEDLVSIFKSQGYEEKDFKDFLVNSLKNDFEEELKEDGLL